MKQMQAERIHQLYLPEKVKKVKNISRPPRVFTIQKHKQQQIPSWKRTLNQQAAGGPTPPTATTTNLAAFILDPHSTPAHLVHTMLTARTVKTRLSLLPSPLVSASGVARVLEHVFAASTLNNRESIYQRYLLYVNRHHLHIGSQSACLFLQSLAGQLGKPVTIQGQHQYGKDLMAIMNYGHVDTTILSLYLKGLRAMGALVPIAQAIPMMKEHVVEFSQLIPQPRTRWAVLVAWKAASRWEDLYDLPFSSIVESSPERVIIDWMRNTKSTRMDPYRMSRYTVIEGDLTSQIHELFLTIQASPDRMFSDECATTPVLTKCTTSKMAELLKVYSTRLALPTHYTCHSFKHGALNHAMHAIANGAKVDPTKVALLAKHKMVTDLVSVTVRYIQDRASAALVFGTQEVTRLL